MAEVSMLLFSQYSIIISIYPILRLKDSRSICIENSSNSGYQTEKIIDALLTKTIPVYWGCTNIGDYYNLDGIIHCKDENEIIQKVNQLTPEYYYSRKDVIEENYIKAQFYADIFSRFVNIMKEIVKYNDV